MVLQAGYFLTNAYTRPSPPLRSGSGG